MEIADTFEPKAREYILLTKPKCIIVKEYIHCQEFLPVTNWGGFVSVEVLLCEFY